jgi:hypothetical protein
VTTCKLRFPAAGVLPGQPQQCTGGEGGRQTRPETGLGSTRLVYNSGFGQRGGNRQEEFLWEEKVTGTELKDCLSHELALGVLRLSVFFICKTRLSDFTVPSLFLL